MRLGLLGGLVYLASLCSLWCVPLGLIHYRGLVNRQRAATPYDRRRVAAAPRVVGIVGVHARELFRAVRRSGRSTYSPTRRPRGRSSRSSRSSQECCSSSRWLAVVLLAAVARAAERPFPTLVGDGLVDRQVRADRRGCGSVLSPAAVRDDAGRHGPDARAAARQLRCGRLLLEVDELYGPAAALWVLSLAAPVGEEFIFRGLLLRASMRHVSFPLANTVQASLFSAMHFDLAAAPYLFVVRSRIRSARALFGRPSRANGRARHFQSGRRGAGHFLSRRVLQQGFGSRV